MRTWMLSIALVGAFCIWGQAQATTINGSAMAMRSIGIASGTDWILNENGYVGTYISLSQAGTVHFTLNASGSTTDSVWPRMNLVVADSKVGWNVSSGFNNYNTSLNLPAGTYFVRTEFANDVPTADRRLSVRSIQITGASVSNSSTPSVLNTNALAAADTYIQNFRKGPGVLYLPGLASGTQVRVQLTKHAFHFGTAVPGNSYSGVYTYLNPSPPAGSVAQKFQQALLANFNAVVPENAGKWVNNEPTRDIVTMSNVDLVLSFAQTHGLAARMHNLIWGNQQPTWVNTLLSQAQSGNQTAKNDLREEITERIAYYVNASRARQYYELDVYNEFYHTPAYWNVYGASGVADIYREVQQAVNAAGANVRLFANEYNVIQDTTDYYGNWYRRLIEQVNNAGYGQVVTGIGIQSYPNATIGNNAADHNPGRIMQVLQGLSVLELPLALTEFGVKDEATEATAAQILQDQVRLVFGTPQATGFYMWGFWQGSIYRGAAALYDANWNLRLPGQVWQDLFSLDGDANPYDDWTTDLTLTVGPDGLVPFNGFYGDYRLTIGSQTYTFSLTKGANNVFVYSFLVGDLDRDGDVDQDDLNVLLANWGRSVGSALGNLDGRGVVDDFDLNMLLARWTGPWSGPGSQASPEPAGLVMWLVGAAGVWGRRRQKQAGSDGKDGQI